VLLGGMVAAHARDLPADVYDETLLLWHDLSAGRRIVQPRVRHRFQVDRQGLTSANCSLVSTDDGPAFDFPPETGGTPIHFVLAACYAVGMIEADARLPVLSAIRKAMAWQGGLDRSLVLHLTGGETGSMGLETQDPVSWALGILGLDNDDRQDAPTVQKRARLLLREAHPDHGASVDGAADRIKQLTEARRILLG